MHTFGLLTHVLAYTVSRHKSADGLQWVQGDAAASLSEEQPLHVPEIDTGILQRADAAFVRNVAELLFALGVFTC